MTDEPVEMHEQESSPLKYVLIAIAGIYVIASLVLFYNLNDKLGAMQKSQTDMQKKMEETDSKLRASTETLAAKLGMTEKELAARTDQLQRAQRSTSAKQAELGQQIGEVNTQVAGVKTDVGAVKGDVASTKSDLEATKTKLERTIGDLNVQSGLIAHTRDDLEFLKHKGDRNIYEFTLKKGQKTPVSSITLQLKKADAKKNKFTMNVIADDRTIEKKDRTAFEPMQFYTGRDRMLYEVVVMSVDKNQISGYLSTPKSAPLPPQ
jgi:septal ring factor EnvC (AmiA/AmiB activator)